MSTIEGDFWVCAECRSINNARAKQCYNCRTPRDLAAVDPTTIEGTGHGKLREVALPTFHSPRPYAAIASILILATAGLQVVQTVGITTLLLQILGGTEATDEQLAYVGIVGLIALAVGAAALVGWSLWLSRAVTSMPALGLGYPAASGMMAFIENFLPGLNLLRVPAIVRDVVRRIEPGSTAGQSRGEALIFAAWIALLGGFVIPRVAAFTSGFSSDSPAGVIRTQLTIQGVATGLVLVGALFLVALIWWIEERIDRRREAQLAQIDATTAGARGESDDGVDEAPATRETVPGTSVTSPRITEPPAAWSWGGSSASPIAASSGAVATTGNPASGADAPMWTDAPVMPPAAGWESAPIQAPTEDGEPAPHRWADWSQPARAASTGSVDSAPRVAEPEAAIVDEHEPDDEPEPDVEPIAEPEPEIAAEPQVAEEPQVAQAPEDGPEPEPDRTPEPVVAQAAAPAPEAAPQPDAEPQPEHEPETEPQPIENGAPHLTIRVARMGMIQAEMAGETEPVILEDLPTYGTALANAGGSAEIVVTVDDPMAHLIAKRAQQILAETGIEASLAG